MPGLSDKVKAFFVGNPFGEVYPPRPAPPPLPNDGRTIAMRLLFDYISELTFYRSGDTGGDPIPFQIGRDTMQIEAPGAVGVAPMPSIGILPGDGVYAAIGLTAYWEESTRDQFSRGTVLQWQSEYTETFQLEVLCSTKAERRAIISGLEAALVPTEQWYALRFVMKDYFNQLAAFALQSRSLDDTDAVRGRRRVKFKIELRHNVVALVNYNEFFPQTGIVVFDNGQTPDPQANTELEVRLPLDSW